MVTRTRPGEEGSILLALLLALGLLLFTGMGVWGFLRHWRHLAETQLRLFGVDQQQGQVEAIHD